MECLFCVIYNTNIFHSFSHKPCIHVNLIKHLLQLCVNLHSLPCHYRYANQCFGYVGPEQSSVLFYVNRIDHMPIYGLIHSENLGPFEILPRMYERHSVMYVKAAF